MTSGQATHVEVERTFVATGSTDLPDLIGGVVVSVTPVEDADLDATYHDTGDLRLLHAGITLRRREGGDDEGWHVKVKSGDATRLEIHRALTKSIAPPVAVTRLVRGVIRDAVLMPVAEVSTRRRRLHLLGADGEVLAELARDQVTALRHIDGAERKWHEIELELVDGDGPLLAHVSSALARHGIVESSLSSKLGRALGDHVPSARVALPATATPVQVVLAYLAEQEVRLLRQDVGLRAAQPDAVHKMRTALRRLRSALAAYRPLFDTDQARQVEGRLRWLGRELSKARDLEVIERLLQELWDEDDLPTGSSAAARVIRQALSVRRRAAAADVAVLIDSDEYLLLLDEVAAFAAAPRLGSRSAERGPRELRRLLKRIHRRVVHRLTLARDAPPQQRDQALHAARKATKRLRYAAEVAGPLLGKRAERLRRRAEVLSSALGERQDAVVLQQTVRELLPEATGRSAADVAFGLGRVHARLDARLCTFDLRVAEAARRVQTRRAAGWLA